MNDGSSVGKINLNTQYCFGSHRSGWAFVLESLAHLHNDQGLFFNSFIESNFAWVPYPQVYKEKWSGFVHNPPNTPDWFFGFNSLEKIISKPQFQQSIENCVGLFTLSQDLADYVREQTGVKTCSLIHPTEIPEKTFNYEKFLSNKDKKIFLIGYWLRKMINLYRLPLDSSSGYRKIRLVPYYEGQPVEYMRGFLEKQRELCSTKPLKKFEENTFEVSRLENEDYDNLFVENIVFLDLYAASANNGVIESIARATPTLVNKLPSTVEYFGKEYPFFFDSLEEAAEKALDFDLVKKTHEYLLGCSTRKKLSQEYFRKSFEESEIYQSL